MVGKNRLEPPKYSPNALQGSFATFQHNCLSQLEVKKVWDYLYWLFPDQGPCKKMQSDTNELTYKTEIDSQTYEANIRLLKGIVDRGG